MNRWFDCSPWWAELDVVHKRRLPFSTAAVFGVLGDVLQEHGDPRALIVMRRIGSIAMPDLDGQLGWRPRTTWREFCPDGSSLWIHGVWTSHFSVRVEWTLPLWKKPRRIGTRITMDEVSLFVGRTFP